MFVGWLGTTYLFSRCDIHTHTSFGPPPPPSWATFPPVAVSLFCTANSPQHPPPNSGTISPSTKDVILGESELEGKNKKGGLAGSGQGHFARVGWSSLTGPLSPPPR